MQVHWVLNLPKTSQNISHVFEENFSRLRRFIQDGNLKKMSKSMHPIILGGFLSIPKTTYQQQWTSTTSPMNLMALAQLQLRSCCQGGGKAQLPTQLQCLARVAPAVFAKFIEGLVRLWSRVKSNQPPRGVAFWKVEFMIAYVFLESFWGVLQFSEFEGKESA